MRKASEVTYFTHMMIFTMIGILLYGNPETYGVVPFFVTIVLAWLLTLITGFAGNHKSAVI
ncbi:MAG: hypothetical protein LUF30_05690 [Lachnospiraceae bacterium]|nr:hypothetical protein [Lachnospiraceae bacterium]